MSKKILVVDDEPEIVRLIQARLKAKGHDIVTAYDGKEGLEKAREENPDLIISDILMPEVDGLTMVSALKNDPNARGVPVIFLTCVVDGKEIKNKGHLIQGSVFLAKPFDGEELISLVENLLNR